MACANLATYHERRKELEQAEACWQQATAADSERIEYWDRYAKILLARGKTKESDTAQERSFLLEEFYRSRQGPLSLRSGTAAPFRRGTVHTGEATPSRLE